MRDICRQPRASKGVVMRAMWSASVGLPSRQIAPLSWLPRCIAGRLYRRHHRLFELADGRADACMDGRRRLDYSLRRRRRQIVRISMGRWP